MFGLQEVELAEDAREAVTCVLGPQRARIRCGRAGAIVPVDVGGHDVGQGRVQGVAPSGDRRLRGAVSRHRSNSRRRHLLLRRLREDHLQCAMLVQVRVALKTTHGQ